MLPPYKSAERSFAGNNLDLILDIKGGSNTVNASGHIEFITVPSIINMSVSITIAMLLLHCVELLIENSLFLCIGSLGCCVTLHSYGSTVFEG